MSNDSRIRGLVKNLCRLPSPAVLAAAFMATTVGSSQAALLFTANLTNEQEVPPANVVNRPASFGTAVFELNDAQTALTFSVEIFNIDFTGTQTDDLSDNLTAGHIHRAAAGVNGPVIWGFFGGPLNDNNPNDLLVIPFASDTGGTISGKWDTPEGNATPLTAELPFLLAGNTYINIHTVSFPGGEIRGQILQVPEPATLALLGAGLAGFAASRRRKQ